MKTAGIVLLVLFLILLFAAGLFLLYYRTKKEEVMNSTLIQEYLSLRKKYPLTPSNITLIHKHYEEDYYLDDFFPKDYLLYYMNGHMGEFEDYFFIFRKNMPNANLFIHEFELLKKKENFKGLSHYVAACYFQKEEKRILSEIRGEIRVTLTAPLQRKTDVFSYKEVVDLKAKLMDKNGHYYNRRDVWDALCQGERNELTREMKQRVKSRDHYRCRKCGSTENLTIDHILPISKGGKTTLDNLQTLCEKCNKEKGSQTFRY